MLDWGAKRCLIKSVPLGNTSPSIWVKNEWGGGGGC